MIKGYIRFHGEDWAYDAMDMLQEFTRRRNNGNCPDLGFDIGKIWYDKAGNTLFLTADDKETLDSALEYIAGIYDTSVWEYGIRKLPGFIDDTDD